MAALLPEPARYRFTPRLAFASDPSGVREASVAIRNFLAAQGVPDGELFGYELCVAEASNNAIEYCRGPCRAGRAGPVSGGDLLTPSRRSRSA